MTKKKMLHVLLQTVKHKDDDEDEHDAGCQAT